jgi:hypothetical protein
MAASLPTVNTDQIAAKHQTVLTGFSGRQTSLENRIAKLGKITPQIAEEAAELDTDAKRWLDAFTAETKPISDALFRAHRMFTGFVGKMSATADSARSFARKTIGQYQLDQARIAAEGRREQERLAREEAERQRKAEADALIAEAAAIAKDQPEAANELLEAAQAVEEAPVVPVAVPEIAPPKVEGTSVSYKLVGEVKDARALLMFLVEGKRDDLIREIVEFKKTGLNAALRRGIDFGEAVIVTKEAVVRNLSR